MKAAVLREYGVPRLEEFDDPSAKDGVEIVEMLAASLTTLDVRVATGQHPMSPASCRWSAGWRVSVSPLTDVGCTWERRTTVRHHGRAGSR